MTREEIRDEICDYLDDNITVGLANEYTDAVGNATIYEMDDFESEMSCYSYAEVINMAQNGSFDDSDSYFTYDSYSINTFDSLDNEIDVSDMAEHCVENDEDFGDRRIRELLDKLNKDFIVKLHLKGPTADIEEHTLDSLKDIIDFRGGEWYRNSDGEIDHLSAWVNEIGESSADDLELWEVDIEQMLAERKCPEINVVGYEGYAFSIDYVDGRPARWFYSPSYGNLLKLVYDADKFDDSHDYRYIINAVGYGIEKVVEWLSN